MSIGEVKIEGGSVLKGERGEERKGEVLRFGGKELGRNQRKRKEEKEKFLREKLKERRERSGVKLRSS